MRDKAIELVNDMAACIIKEDSLSDPYWQNSAADLLAGLILVLFECAEEKDINFKSLMTLKTQAFSYDSNHNDNNAPFIREKFLKHINPSAFICSLLNGTANVCDNTRGCIISVFDAALRPFFSQNNLIDMLYGSCIDMKSIGNEKTAVFLIIPDENRLYHRLVSVFIKQCYTELIIEAQKHPGKKLPLRVNYILDEFANFPTVSDFPAMITASRSRNIRFNLIIQGFNQLTQKYRYETETIKGNCETWVYLNSKEKTVLEEICFFCGMKQNEEPLATVSLLQRLDKDKGEAIIFHKRNYPFLTSLPDIDSYPNILSGNMETCYPINKEKVLSVFDFVNFCTGKNGYFLSQLFTGRTHEEIENDREGNESYYMCDEEPLIEPFFKTSVPDDEELENIKNEKKSNVYAFCDFHISGKIPFKFADVFEDLSLVCQDEIRKNWENTVEDNDIVLICGNISRAKSLHKARNDLDFFGKLKGKKVFIRGNRDYWWKSISGVRSVLCEDMYAIQNDSIKISNMIICGSRGWIVPEPSGETNEEDIKLYKREIARMRLSLQSAAEKREGGDTLICMTHFPPFNSATEDSGFTALFEEFKVDKVVYGYSHNMSTRPPLYMEKNEIEYYLASRGKKYNRLARIL